MTLETDILIVGSGPAGLSAALELSKNRKLDIAIIDRDSELGGLPHYCTHPGFGYEYTGRFYHSGQKFVSFMLDRIKCQSNIHLWPRTTLLELKEGPELSLLNSDRGFVKCCPREVILCTGIREDPRGPRLIGGNRPPQAFLTTGFLQQFYSLNQRQFFPPNIHKKEKKAVIIGTELVAFSAWLLAKRLGFCIEAFVEDKSLVQTSSFFEFGMKNILGTPIYTNSVISEVEGTLEKISGIWIKEGNQDRFIPCQYVILTGSWQGDTAVAESSGLMVNKATRCLAVDQLFRTSMPNVLATGNVIQPIRNSGQTARLGRLAGATVGFSSSRADSPLADLRLTAGTGLLGISPMALVRESDYQNQGLRNFHVRSQKDMKKAYLAFWSKDELLWEKSLGPIKAYENIFVPLAEPRPYLLNQTQVEARLAEK